MTPSAVAAAVLLLGVASALASTGAFGRFGSGVAVGGALKMAAASGYVVVAVMVGATDSLFGRVMLAGLVLCWLGDLFLIAGGRGAAFLAGLAVFLLGHVAYASAFLVRGIDRGAALLAGVALGVVAGSIYLWLSRSGLPDDMRWPVRAYVVAIAVMVALSFGTAAATPAALLPAGATAFMISDVFVARERFVRAAPVNTRLGLPVYFLGQLLLALGIG